VKPIKNLFLTDMAVLLTSRHLELQDGLMKNC